MTRVRLRLVTLLALGALAGLPSPVFGYSWYGAVTYADAHWNVCGVSQVYMCFPNDCTAFVSESMHSGGGYPWHNPPGNPPYGESTNDHYWYQYYRPIPGNYEYSHSFSVVPDLRQFLIWDIPGGTVRPSKPGTSLAMDSGADSGDVLFYDWDSNGTYTHSNILVGYGSSSDGYYGDYIDGHSNYRYHLYWTTRTYNQWIQTTTISPMHIYASN